MANIMNNTEKKNNVKNAVKKQGLKCKASKKRVRDWYTNEYWGGFGSEPNELYFNGQYLYVA